MQGWIVYIITALILAYLGACLNVAWHSGNYWIFMIWPFLILAGCWYYGEDEDRDMMRSFWQRITRPFRAKDY